MANKSNKPSRLAREMRELAGSMRTSGTMDDATYRKITMRDLDETEPAMRASLSAEEIRALREKAHLSQAVFARYLNLTTG